MSVGLSIGILIQIGNFGHCVFRAVFPNCGVVSISLYYGCMSTATPGDPIAVIASQIPALPPYLETQSGRNTGHNLHVSQTCECKLNLLDVDTRRNETARDGSKPRRIFFTHYYFASNICLTKSLSSWYHKRVTAQMNRSRGAESARDFQSKVVCVTDCSGTSRYRPSETGWY